MGKLNGVVLGNHAFVLNGKDSIQVQVGHWNKSGTLLRGRDHEPPIKFSDVLAAQKVIGFIDAPDLTDSQFLRQPALPGTKVSFTPASRLGRIGRDRLNAQILQ